MSRFRRAHEQPDGGDGDLDADENAAEGELRARADVARPSRRPSAGVEDPRYAVRLDEQRRVAHREEEADPDLLRAAYDGARWRHDHERHGVTAKDPGKEHEAQLASGRLHDGSVAELDEDMDNVRREAHA